MLLTCVYHGEGNVICTFKLTAGLYKKTVRQTDIHLSTFSLHTVNDTVNVGVNSAM